MNCFFSLFPKLNGLDCKAWIIACGQPHDQILDKHIWSALTRSCLTKKWVGRGGGGGGTVLT